MVAVDPRDSSGRGDGPRHCHGAVRQLLALMQAVHLQFGEAYQGQRPPRKGTASAQDVPRQWAMRRRLLPPSKANSKGLQCSQYSTARLSTGKLFGFFR